MHRLARDKLQNHIAVILRTAPKLVQQNLRSKLPSDRDWATNELARLICEQIDNDSYMVIGADAVGIAADSKPGKWGVDEPIPAMLPTAPSPAQR